MKRSLALAFVLAASQAQAGVKDVVLPGLYYAGLNAADYWSSVDAEKRGGVELSPTVKAVGLKPMKIGMTFVEWGGDLLLQKDHTSSAPVWTYRIALFAITTGVVINNAMVQKPKVTKIPVAFQIRFSVR